MRLATPVQHLEIEGNVIQGVWVNGSLVPADHVILATPAAVSAELLRPHAALDAQLQGFDELRAQPICTLYLRYPDRVTLERDMIGLLDALPQWLFDRGRLNGDKGLIAAVISGPGAHLRLSNEDLIAQVISDIARQFPAWPPPSDTKLIRERRATLAAVPGVDAFRPNHATHVKGLWLAGDYTASGYPSTLEGAVRSGLLCARWVRRHTTSVGTRFEASQELEQ